MTEEFFLQQIERLKGRFGAKSFDREFIRVAGTEVVTMPDEAFRRAVDAWIGSRKNNNPPLATDFRDARLNYERGCLDKVVKQASNIFNYGLKDVLRKHYNVDSLDEAIQLEKLKIKLGGADDQGGTK